MGDETTDAIRALGARRKRLREELTSVEAELHNLMPAARQRLSQEAIRRMTDLSFPTIRRYAVK